MRGSGLRLSMRSVPARTRCPADGASLRRLRCLVDAVAGEDVASPVLQGHGDRPLLTSPASANTVGALRRGDKEVAMTAESHDRSDHTNGARMNRRTFLKTA